VSKATEHSRFASIFAAGTLLSRAMGLIRDSVMFAFIPAFSIDAFLVAFKFPNMLREVVGEGASNAAFVPLFSEALEKKSGEEFKVLVSAVLSAMIVLLALLTVLGILALPTIVGGITALDIFTGKEPPSAEKVELITSISIWTFPYLFMICLAVFCMAPLFTLKHYSTPSWSPVLLNISIILCCLLFYKRFMEPAYALVAGAWLGGVAQLLVQYIALVNVSGIKIPNFKLNHPAIRQVMWLLLPVIIGQSAGEINKLVDTLFAASLPDPGTVRNLYSANRLIQFPLSIFAVATSVAILPNLAKLHTKGEHDELRINLMQGMRQSFFFIMPAMAGLFILGYPVIALLFERGEFTTLDTDMASIALMYYAGGLLAFAWVKIVVTGFYAMQDTRTPVIIASCAMILNILLNFALIGPLGVKGLALSTTISYGLNCLVLYLVLSYRVGRLWDEAFINSLVRVLVATVFMGATAYGTWAFCASSFDPTTFVGKSMIALIPIVVGMILYALLARTLSIPEYEYFMNGLRKRTNS